MRRALFVLFILFAVLQAIPYGRRHTNPPIAGEPPWDSPRTRRLFFKACGDCHSNETRWPWYAWLAPASWLVQHDVEEGREKFNVSEWGTPGRKQEAKEAAEELEEGEMPPPAYLFLHPSARLDPEEKARLLEGLEATFGREEEDGEEDELSWAP
jgi:mono/diheme cytochrome c family protein